MCMSHWFYLPTYLPIEPANSLLAWGNHHLFMTKLKSWQLLLGLFFWNLYFVLGYYRVNYDEANWDKLISVLNNSETASQIHEYNRAQIIDDAANLGASLHKTYLPYSVTLRLLATMRHERSLIVWRPALRAMRDLRMRFSEHQEILAKLEVIIAY